MLHLGPHLPHAPMTVKIPCFLGVVAENDMDNKHLTGFSMHRQDRTAVVGKVGGGVCLFVNKNVISMSPVQAEETTLEHL
jgi:hypothetical protein